MLADRRAEALVDNFAEEWLRLRHVKEADPDTGLFPQFSRNLGESMTRETKLLFEDVMRGDRSILDLLTAKYTFVDGVLARHYGMANVQGSTFRKVAVTDPNRYGLLGQASILTLTSLANRTSPVLRGKYVMEVFLGVSPPPPPPNVPALVENVENERPLPVRERLAEHRKSPACAACHKMMDPIGLSLENFDAIGLWRTVDSGAPIDPSGELYDGTALSGPVSLRNAILSRSDAFVGSFTESLLVVRPRPADRLPRHARGPRDRARRGARRQSLLVLHPRRRQERAVRDAARRRRADDRAGGPGARADPRRKPLGAVIAMYITRKHLSRRTVLRGMGASMALPFLEAMVPAQTLLRKTAAAPKIRLACIEMVHGSAGSTVYGLDRNLWMPAKEGSDFEFTPILKPVEPFRDYVTVITHTDLHAAEAWTAAEEGADHFRSSAVFLTAAHPKQTEGSDVHAGTSIDQSYANRFGQDTPLPSIQLGIENVDAAGTCGFNYACVYSGPISWASPTEAMPTTIDPRMAFENLFGEGGTAEERAARQRASRSIMDGILREVAGLRGQLGAGDRRRLDAYLDGIREIERRIQNVERRNASGEARELPSAPIGVPDSWEEHVKLMFDLQVLAFASETTRISSFKLSRDTSNRVFAESGIKAPFHAMSHHGSVETKIDEYAKLNVVPHVAAAVLSRQAPQHARWRRQPARSFARSVGQSHGRLEHAHAPEAARARRRPRERTDQGQPAPALQGRNPVHQRAADPAAHARRGPAADRRQHGRGGDMRTAMLCLAGLLAAAVASAAPADTRLVDAARRHDAAAVRTLIAEGVDVNAADGDGSTALHWAAYHGDAALTDALLKAGASVKAVTRIGAHDSALDGGQDRQRPRHRLAARGRRRRGRSERERNDRPDAGRGVRERGFGDPLLDRGANPNAADVASGQTALMFAAAAGSADAIRVLLARKADPSVETRVFTFTRVKSRRERRPAAARRRREAGREGASRRRAGSCRASASTRTARRFRRRPTSACSARRSSAA